MLISYNLIQKTINTKFNKNDYLYILFSCIYNSEEYINSIRKDRINPEVFDILKINNNSKKIKIQVDVSDELLLKTIKYFDVLDLRLFFVLFISFKPILTIHKKTLEKYLHIKTINYKDIEDSLNKLKYIINLRFSIKKEKLNIIVLNRFNPSKDLTFYNKQMLQEELKNNYIKYSKSILTLLNKNKTSIAYLIFTKNNDIKTCLNNDFFIDFLLLNKKYLKINYK
jgi:hypothetical protein